MAGMSRLLLFLLALSVSAQTGEWEESSSFTPNFWVSHSAHRVTQQIPVFAPGSRITVSISPGIDMEKPYSLQYEGSTGSIHEIQLILSQWFNFNTQFEAVLPMDLSPEEGKIILNYNENQKASQQVKIASSRFGLYGRKNSWQIAEVLNTSAEGAVKQNGMTTPARPGDYLTLWGTGLGAEIPKSLYVVIGGRQAKIVWAGKAPADPGVDQINVYLNPNVKWKEGCFVPVRVRVNGEDSMMMSISLAREGACQHPYGFNLEELKQLDRGEDIQASSVKLTSTLNFPFNFAGVGQSGKERTWLETARVNFGKRQMMTPVPGALFPESGICTYSERNLRGDFSSGLLGVDAGKSVQLQGPGRSIEMPQMPLGGEIEFVTLRNNFVDITDMWKSGLYQATIPSPQPQSDISLLPPPVLREGIWTLKVPGGASIASFEQAFTVPPIPMPVNLEEIKVVDRTTVLPIRWNPAGYGVDDRLEISIGSLSCVASAQSGEFLIPSAELKQLPPSGQTTFLTSPNDSINIQFIGTPQLFSVPKVNGEDMRGYYHPTSIVSIPTTIR